MVEASILYPVIIGAVMAVIYIIICMYTGAAMRANLNIELRNQILQRTETGEKVEITGKFLPQDKYGKGAFNKKICFTEEKKQGMNVLYGIALHSYKGNSMMSNIITRKHQGELYIINEKEYIRKADMIIQ